MASRLGANRLVVATVLVILTAGSALLASWLNGTFLPSWVAWEKVELACDLDGDGDFEALSLRDRRLAIYDGDANEPAAQLRDGWFVQDALVTDVDADGELELVCLTWKRGSYGNTRPFWVEANDLGFSQHVFIYNYRCGEGGVGGELVQKWLSSDVGIQIKSIDSDALGRLCLGLADGSEKFLEWQNWGLTYLDSEDDASSMRDALADATTLVVAGDVIPHEGLLREGDETGFSRVFAGVSPLVAGAGIAAVNLEAPVVEGGLVSGEFPAFGAPQTFAQALLDAGFGVVELANNHILDQSEEGLAQALAFWEGVGATTIGLDGADGLPAATVVESDGVKVALLNATAVMNGDDGTRAQAAGVSWAGDGEELAQAVADAESRADLTVVLLHAGEEYADEPTAAVEELVEKLVDAGADAVICAHPHVAQRAELLTADSGKSAYVCYSLGNLVANQPYASTVLGEVARLTLVKPRDGEAYVASCELVPTVCHYADGETRAVPLAEYTAELADSHYLNSLEAGSVTLDGLRVQWLQTICGGK